MSHSIVPSPRPTHRLVLWLVGFVAFFAIACVARNYPPLPAELTLRLKFPPGQAGRLEPLVSAGVYEKGDFLFVRYLDETTAEFIYNYWGFPGVTSERFTFSPGALHTIRLTLPAFTALHGTPTLPLAPLRLDFDGRELFNVPVPYHHRPSAQIFFGENQVGGTGAGTVFTGEIFTAAGLLLSGPPSALFTWPVRVTGWLAAKPGEAFVVSLLAAASAFFSRWLCRRLAGFRLPRTPAPEFAGHTRPPHLWFLFTASVCTTAFLYVVTGGTFRLIYHESFGNFYDYQAVGLLHSRLDVPEAALGSEAFVYAGKIYGYFGPTPALLRIPFVAFDVAFGQLSRAFMLAYFVASLAAVYALLIHASRLLSRSAAWPGRIDVVLLVSTAGLGSTLFFLSSRAYIYHEAILCGVAFALWSCWCSLRWLAAPDTRWWLGALVCGTLAVHSRPPVGLFALTLLGCVAATHLWQARAAGLRAWLRPICIGLLSIFGVLSFNGLSYLKFQSFDGAPLRYHVQYTPGRLANIEGKNFHPANFRYNFDSYLWQPNFEFLPRFPYFYMTGRKPNDYPGSKIDLAEPSLALPYTTPAIFALSLVGAIFALVRRPASRLPLAVLAFATLPMSAALFMAVAISQRYTADFLPALLIAAAFGLVSIGLLPRRLHRAAQDAVATLALCSILITAAITIHYQGELVWGVPPDVTARYHSLRQTIDAFFGFNYHDR